MKPIKRVKLHSTVAKEIEDYIKQNNIQQGGALPSEREIAEKLQIGRSSVREGLRMLEGMGIIEVKPGKGIYVKNYSPFVIKTNIEIAAEKESLLQVMEVRRILEQQAIELAIKRATEEDIKEVEDKYAVLKSVEATGDDASEEDKAFHQAIYRASKNEILPKMIDSIGDLFYKIWESPFGENHIFKSAFCYHQELLSALKNRDLKKARKSVNDLMDSIEKKIMSVILLNDKQHTDENDYEAKEG